jgi:4-oxalocrotonate tautomerase
MPHVIVKMLSGRTEEQKIHLAEDITKVIMKHTGNTQRAVSIAIEDIQQSEWIEKVYNPDIAGNLENLYKKPGYDPSA